MRENLTEVVFILDRSGSMSGLEADTIGGFNSMLERQKEEKGDAYLTTVLFDNQVEYLHDRIDIQKVNPITSRDYYVRGCTALLDAVGMTIEKIKHIHANAIESDVPAKTIFIINTDGMENASREYNYSGVRKMIKEQQEREDWEFIFLGANIDSEDMAEHMGIKKNHAFNYANDEEGVGLNFRAMHKCVSTVREKKRFEDVDSKLCESMSEVTEHHRVSKRR